MGFPRYQQLMALPSPRNDLNLNMEILIDLYQLRAPLPTSALGRSIPAHAIHVVTCVHSFEGQFVKLKTTG